MRRGDLVTIAISGDYGKPRPAVVIQSDTFAKSDSVLVCQLTTNILEADMRLPIEPDPSNGLRARSQIMVEKIFAVRRERCGPAIGRLDSPTLARLDEILALVIGLADSERS